MRIGATVSGRGCVVRSMRRRPIHLTGLGLSSSPAIVSTMSPCIRVSIIRSPLAVRIRVPAAKQTASIVSPNTAKSFGAPVCRPTLFIVRIVALPSVTVRTPVDASNVAASPVKSAPSKTIWSPHARLLICWFVTVDVATKPDRNSTSPVLSVAVLAFAKLVVTFLLSTEVLPSSRWPPPPVPAIVIVSAVLRKSIIFVLMANRPPALTVISAGPVPA